MSADTWQIIRGGTAKAADANGNPLFPRKCSVFVGDNAGGLDVSVLRCVFTVSQFAVQTPTTCNLRIYNLSSDGIEQLKGLRLVVQAGYESQYGVVFDGLVIQKLKGRENETDTYLDIVAVDGYSAYANAYMNQTLEAGYSQEQLYQTYIDSVTRHDVTAGAVPGFSPLKYPRGKVMYGPTRDYIREFATQANCRWGIDQNTINLEPIEITAPTEDAVEVNALTGLVGTPQQTLDGINLTTLMNPKIRGGQHGRWIHINNKTVINLMRPSTAIAAGTQFSNVHMPDGTLVTTFPSIAADGFYRVYSASHHGDTRGQAWHTNIIAASPDGQYVPLQGPFRWAQEKQDG